MPTYKPKSDTVEMIQFTAGAESICAVARFCVDHNDPDDRRFRITPGSNGDLVAEYLPGPGWTWQPLAPGAWLVRLPDGTAMAVPAAFSDVLAALFEEVK